MNGESNLPSIYPSHEMPTLDDNQEADDFDQSLMQSFRDEVLSSFDPISPKIIELERTFAKSIPQSRNNNNINFSEQIKDYQQRIKELHTKSIETSRRVQSLTLSAQTSSALAIPRLMKPVNDHFCIFKDEFDETLKNLALLSGRINQKTQVISGCLDTYKKSPQTFGNSALDIQTLNTKTIENEKLINDTIETASELIEEAETDMSNRIDKEMQNAEETLKELEETVEKGQNEAESFSQRMITDRESIQQSFLGLSSNVEKVITEKLNELNESIENATKRSTALIETIQNNLSDEFDQLLKNDSCEIDSTFFDQIESAKEEAQLVSLLNKLEELQNKIYEVELKQKSIKEQNVNPEVKSDQNSIENEQFIENPNQNEENQASHQNGIENETNIDNQEEQNEKQDNEGMNENEQQVSKEDENQNAEEAIKDEMITSVNENTEEVFEKLVDGEMIRFYCNNIDGTFHF